MSTGTATWAPCLPSCLPRGLPQSLFLHSLPFLPQPDCFPRRKCCQSGRKSTVSPLYLVSSLTPLNLLLFKMELLHKTQNEKNTKRIINWKGLCVHCCYYSALLSVLWRGRKNGINQRNGGLMLRRKKQTMTYLNQRLESNVSIKIL